MSVVITHQLWEWWLQFRLALVYTKWWSSQQHPNLPLRFSSPSFRTNVEIKTQNYPSFLLSKKIFSSLVSFQRRAMTNFTHLAFMCPLPVRTTQNG